MARPSTPLSDRLSGLFTNQPGINAGTVQQAVAQPGVEQSVAASRAPAGRLPAVAGDRLAAARSNPALVTQMNANKTPSRLATLRPGEDVTFGPATGAAPGTVSFQRKDGTTTTIAGAGMNDTQFAAALRGEAPAAAPVAAPSVAPAASGMAQPSPISLSTNFAANNAGVANPQTFTPATTPAAPVAAPSQPPAVPRNSLLEELGAGVGQKQVDARLEKQRLEGLISPELYRRTRAAEDADRASRLPLPRTPAQKKTAEAGAKAAIATAAARNRADAARLMAAAAKDKAEAQKTISEAKSGELAAKADATERMNNSKLALEEAKVRFSYLQDILDQRKAAAERTPAAVSSRLQALFTGTA